MQSIGLDLHGFGASIITKTWRLQRSYNWQLMMPHNINGIAGYLVSQYCQEVRFGDYTMSDVASMRYGPEQRFYAGLQTIDTVSLSFLKPVDNSVLTYFYGWYELTVDQNGYYYPKNHYKKDIFVILYNKMGTESTKFKLKGTWLKRRPSYTLSYASEDILRVEVELCVDFIEIKKGLFNKLVETIF